MGRAGCSLGWRRSFWLGVLPLVLLGWTKAAEPPGPARRPDTVGGMASDHIVVRLTKPFAETFARERVRSRTPLLATLEATASTELAATSGRWNAARMRPVFSFGFAHPALAASHGLDRYFVLETARGADLVAMAADFATNRTEIADASVDTIGGIGALMPNDPSFDVQWGMHNDGSLPGSVADADIDAPEAWDIETGVIVDPVTIAVIDSGVDPHSEFGARLTAGINTADPNPNGTGDDCGFGHGTHVAGIAAAGGNNGLGVAGVCWGCDIMPVDVLLDILGGCSGNVTDLSEGIVWAADNGADVISLSLQYCNLSPAEETLLENAVNYAHALGIVVVAATGNNQLCGAGEIAWPARLPNALAVGGITKRNEVALNGATTNWTSNWGPEIDLVAPGDAILSCAVGNGYRELSGTSMATPHVSGTAALLRSADPTLTNTEIEELIKLRADDMLAPGWDQDSGYGRLNAFRAVRATQPDNSIPAVSTWGMIVMMLLALIAGTIASARFSYTRLPMRDLS